MTQNAYFFDTDNRFVIEQYNDQPAFASFLPGIAGTGGRPAWVFYVNRGQAIASFGVRNKDGAFLEFFPADKAYQLTASRGFRTFLKITDGAQVFTHEPFQRGAASEVRQRLYVTPHELSIEEFNPQLEFTIRVDLFTLPEAPVAALIRRITISNHSSRNRKIDIIDGLPQVLPYALNQWIVKFMSRTSEAFMRIEGIERNLPFYRLKVWPTDSPQVEPVIGGNFFFGLLDGVRNRVLVDAEKVFGLAGDFSRAERFFSHETLDFDNQVLGNQTPSAFQAVNLDLPPDNSQTFYGVYGHAESASTLEQFLSELTKPDYFEHKRQQNQQLIEEISQCAFTKTAYPLFDAHVRQCYLDNGLRGGFPRKVPGEVYLYLFGRKHGDLERDYNDFLLQDLPFSEGNGDFRDVLQNRRMDLFFEPELDTKNIRYFFNLIQPDGNNPCSLRNSRFILPTPEKCAQFFQQFIDLETLLQRPFKYAELWQIVAAGTDNPEPIIKHILTHTQEIEDAEFDRGYWSDHWTYLVDLLISYQAIFPDRLSHLFLEPGYSFFDPTHFVVPRQQKYVLTANGIRQYGAVRECAEKKALIESRTHHRYQVRAQHGRGEIVQTSLLGKIITLVANKLASLDPFGVGIMMEADRPGWCDALNGLPGIFGSAVNETIELKRLVDFTRNALTHNDVSVALPVELADFVFSLQDLLNTPELTAGQFWLESNKQKEAYRESVFMGFDGGERFLSIQALHLFLKTVSSYLDGAIDKARTQNGIITYYSYEAVEYQPIDANQVNVSQFLQKPLPLFLEGFVHALRIATPEQARTLYTAARNSELFDEKLGMYRLNAPLGENALALGRIGVFNYGWLENGSIFLHMHYKFVLEMVRAGLIEEFYLHLEQLLVAFHDPQRYQRNPVENSSFLVSSGFTVDPRQHGRGCVARLSGSTVELLHLWSHLFLGANPFKFEQEQLVFCPDPVLSRTFFSTDEQTIQFGNREEKLPANSVACALLSKTLLVYINDKLQDTFGESGVKPCEYQIHGHDGSIQTVKEQWLTDQTANALRLGEFCRVHVYLA